MKIRTLIIGGAAALALTACGGGSGNYEADYETLDSGAPVMAESAYTKSAPSEQRTRGPAEPADNLGPEPGAEQYIAYRHNLGLTLPKGGVEPMLANHTEACRAAGTTQCIVINSNLNTTDENYANGYLSIRAKPDWIETFMGGMEDQAEKAGGEVTSRSTSAEDLTRQITDTGARLGAQKMLQSRLLRLLETRDGELGDLLQIEREYARVTGDIESVEATLRALRLRVSMSSLDIGYQTIVPPFSSGRENPLGQAFGDFFHNLSGAIAAVITAFAIGLPWILLLGLFLWIWMKLIWPRLRGKKTVETQPKPE